MLKINHEEHYIMISRDYFSDMKVALKKYPQFSSKGTGGCIECSHYEGNPFTGKDADCGKDNDFIMDIWWKRNADVEGGEEKRDILKCCKRRPSDGKQPERAS